MNGIVKQVQGNGSIQLKHGLFYKYEVTIEADGKTYTGEYLSKSDNQNKFVTGDGADFEYTGGQWPKIKPVSNFEQSAPSKSYSSNTDRDTIIARQSSLKCATDYVIANGGDVARIIEIAEALTDYVVKGTKPTPAPTSNDLPF
jgi:hypothetical protein